MPGIQIEWKASHLLAGLALILMGLLAPLFLTVNLFGIYPILYQGLQAGDQGMLMLAAFRLVALNTVRAMPHYLGVFLLSQSVKFKRNEKTQYWIQGVAMIMIIYMVYQLIRIIYNIRYDFGGPALMILVAIVLLAKFQLNHIAVSRQSIIIILILMGVQWLDVIPALTPFGFGRGETSVDLKQSAAFMQAQELLSYSAALMVFILLVNAFLVSKILKDQHQLVQNIEKQKNMEDQLVQTRLQALEARSFQEIQHLVHDLKTPLTSIGALSGVAEMISSDVKLKNYMQKIGEGVDTLNSMITEILYEDNRKRISTGKLFDIVFNQIAAHPCREKIIYHNTCKEKTINVNAIRIARALVNLMMNAYDAIDPDKGYIYVQVNCEAEEEIVIEIADNGTGIDEKIRSQVWEIGHSGTASTGLGLHFVKKIITSHHGELQVESEPGEGTRVTVSLREVEER